MSSPIRQSNCAATSSDHAEPKVKSSQTTKAAANKKEWRQKEKVKYENKLAAKAAAGEPNDDHIFKWRGPKGGRYRGYGKSYKGSKSKTPRRPVSLGDMPYEIILQIAEILHGEQVIGKRPVANTNALAQVNTVTYKWLNPFLYDQNIKSGQCSALFWAARHGNENTIKRMKAFGADLTITAETNHLYDQGFLSGIPSMNGNALHVAVKYGQLNIVNLLIREGLNIHELTLPEASEFAYSPIELAIKSNQRSVAMRLIQKGADINQRHRSNRPSIERLLDLWDYGVDMSFEDQIFWLQLLLHSGAKWFDVSYCLEQAFQYLSIGYKDPDIKQIPILLEILFEHGADVNANVEPIKSLKSLHLASFVGLEDIVKYLLEQGADVEARDRYGQTPLFYAVSMRGLGYGLLLDCDDPEEEENRWTYARWDGSIEVVKMLLEHGADPEAETTDGMTPQKLAAFNTNRSFRTIFGKGLVAKRKGEVDGNETKDQNSDVVSSVEE